MNGTLDRYLIAMTVTGAVSFLLTLLLSHLHNSKLRGTPPLQDQLQVEKTVEEERRRVRLPSYMEHNALTVDSLEVVSCLPATSP
ncbi:hypothetical protein GCK32_021592 [Trichostrongylus colubriformis]|uniref:Uncharacterized protein n=1 Tax=Trichostrongylus colubriformis TaxID=6319 RepID=A0AAN8IZI9_TRICO